LSLVELVQKQHASAIKPLTERIDRLELGLERIVITSKNNRWWMATLLAVAEIVHLGITLGHK
jgi:hypothetical protein